MSGPAQGSGFLAGLHAIDGYGAGGFNFGDMSHRGSILAVPSGVYSWPVTVPGDITAASLAPVFAAERGTIELLLLGTGLDLVPVPEPLRRQLKSAGIVVDPMATGAAARTYNILLGERRRVAVALIAIG